MSKNYYQKTYQCECLIDPWGSTCNSESKFVLIENASNDTNAIYHKLHNDEWKVYVPGEYISDSEIAGLKALLNGNELDESIDPSLYEYLKNK